MHSGVPSNLEFTFPRGKIDFCNIFTTFPCFHGPWVKINLPVQQFTGLKKASVKVKPIRYSTFSENMAEPETHQFGAYLYLTATRFYAGEIPSSTSGYLSCHSISKPSLKSEIYVYTEWGTDYLTLLSFL